MKVRFLLWLLPYSFLFFPLIIAAQEAIPSTPLFGTQDPVLNAPAPQILPQEDRESQSVVIPPVIRESRQSNLLVLKPTVSAPYAGQERDIQELYDLIIFDLQFSGAYQVFGENPQSVYLSQQDDQRGAVDYEEWRRLRVSGRDLDYVVKTNLIPRGPGQIQINILAYDLVQGQRPFGQAYGAAPTPPITRATLRRAGHKATADIVTVLENGTVQPVSESRIAFVNFIPEKKTKELYLVDYDGWRDSLQQITFSNSVTLFPDWSPDGSSLAYISYKSKWPSAYVQSLAGGSVKMVANYLGTNTTPRWYPDGQNIAISLSVQGNSEIYRINVNSGGKPHRLTNNSSADISPDVSPDGSQIAFTSDRWANTPQIYIMNADGSNQRRISYVDRKCDTPFWSPVPVPTSYGSTVRDNYRIAFTGFFGSGQSDVYTIFPDGSDPQILGNESRRGLINQSPTWSPNARFIAFSSNMEGKPEIFLMSSERGQALPNGKAFHRVTYLAGENTSPAWSPK